ncbi:hypothetical protein FRACYDRAFT_236230 [Fragilariopsis cylindrus CCMP1102]|uniref:Fe2OG dioxygenase domain-containing protein n=1 Tax=Fragilariopsis cylindrus CCMP1102 TaxID=635003 RepID=A0A1E7FPS6_9STRA|nr:hypothetical protein FRACYDRAFT_236230 [Fragilariopsis cylindrus CCMP1102]|eukprot:OEU20161.1 hypothetical protein FRACYDRAFT_236230 [Fragilariopsis cylindrus CCMP1102]
MGKSKKRSRTKALHEAAANAAAAANKAKQQRRLLEDDNEIDNDDKKETTTSTEKGTSTITGTTTAPTVSDIAITIKTIKYLTINNNGNGNGNDGDDGNDGDGDETNTSTNNNYDLFHNSKQYKELRKVIHPLIIDRINKVYKNGIDYRSKVTNHLQHQRWLPALGALQGVKDYNQIPKQGTIQRWVRDVDSVDNNSNKIKMKLLSSILNCTNVTSNHSTNTTTTTTASSDGDDATATAATANMNKHDPLHALMAAQQKNSSSNNNSNIDDEYDEYDDDDDEYDNNDNSMKEKKEKGAIDDDDEDELKILKGWRIPTSSLFPSSSLDDNSLLLSKLKSITTTTGTGTELNTSNSNSSSSKTPNTQTQTQVVYREKASERTPPNHYDLILHATTTSTICETTEDDDEETEEEDEETEEEDEDRIIIKHNIPFLNTNGHSSSGAFVLENVLSSSECNEFIEMSSGSTATSTGSTISSNIVGYQKDHPLTLKEPTGIDSFEWYISKTIHNIIYNRVYKYLPKKSNHILTNNNNNSKSTATATATATGEEKEEEEEKRNNNNSNNSNILYGINRRWRFFRYGQDCVYRPHIDGSWPDSSLTKIKVKKNHNTTTPTASTDTRNETDNTLYEYKYEVDKTGNTRSYLTFLIYLNDNFEGGETKFYYPVTTTTTTTTTTSTTTSNKDNNTDNDTPATATATKTQTSLVARGVIPKRGSVLVFPQGNTASLLHEGSAVTKGIKYVIRTDVLYQQQQQS